MTHVVAVAQDELLESEQKCASMALSHFMQNILSIATRSQKSLLKSDLHSIFDSAGHRYRLEADKRVSSVN